MKGGKFEERSMGPMFPRLHVNDAERGGPRAPPRNKMALYEQLTIPSNRYSYGNVHPNPHNGSNLVPTGSSSQGTSRERFMRFPLYEPPAEPTPPSQSVDGLQRQPSNVVNLRSSAPLGERQQKPEDEDDFAVPIFSRQGKEQCNGAHQSSNIEDRGRDSSSTCPVQKETGRVENANSRQDRQCQDDERRKACVSGSAPTAKYSADVSVRESSDGGLKSPDDSATIGHEGVNGASMSKCTNTNNRCSDYTPCKSMNEAEGGTALRLKSGSPSGPSSKRDKFDRRDEINQRGDTLPRDTGTDDVSQTSMVVATPDLDVSPDDVVDIIGLKHFFKARKAIVNQQRVFAVQVFELHRLIKVQKLIAKSPEILLEASAFLGSSPIEVPPLKEVSAKYALKALADSDKRKGDIRSPDHSDRVEGAAESAAARAPTAASPTHTQPSSHQPFLVDPALGSHTAASPPLAANPKASPWSFPQAGAHQWLVPVMSPSEGLIYKPYPGPGFPDPVFGGCGPHSTMPPVGPFMNAAYGAPPSPYYHPHQATPFGAQGYFPPYGMSMMSSSMSGPANAKNQVNRPSGSHPNGENSQKGGATRDASTQQQGSCNIPTRKRHNELLGSTGSSPSHAVRAKGKDALTPFPSTPSKKAPQAWDDQPNMVIKVVPHNARTATESAARIFRSIQEERQKQQSSS